MYEISYSNQFEKDLKLTAKRGYNTELLLNVVGDLHTYGKLDSRYRTHKLQGQYNSYISSGIKPCIPFTPPLKGVKHLAPTYHTFHLLTDATNYAANGMY